jgi:hypothetical protein
LVVPVLVEKLAAPNTTLWRGYVMDALGSFGESAKPAIPFIVPRLKDANIDNRSAATNALNAIEADAAAKAGLK